MMLPLAKRQFPMVCPLTFLFFIVVGQSIGVDVVLIDTAGRMEDNDNLMRAISKVESLEIRNNNF